MDEVFSAESAEIGFPSAGGVGGTGTTAAGQTGESSGSSGYSDATDVEGTRTSAPGTSSGRAGQDLHIKPIARSHVVIEPPPGWIISFSWNTIFAGDCRMVGARLHLYPDAMIFFQSHTISADDDDTDVWIHYGIDFRDQFGVQVGQRTPKHVGMEMAWQGSEYPLAFWDAIPGVNPTGAAQIRGARIFYHC